ncbi:MAG: glycosyltransferase family 2 protein [Patescibacteria group bacterium]|nr:glycosyltransferase family 2 protein [Patescibacteria group bacterium]
MKLIIQIPCYNEEKTLPLVINSIPKKIKGIDKIETLIIDDGSKDKTIEIAKKLKVDYIVKHHGNKGLARAFASGIEACLKNGADIIVNTDGDNQYPQAEIGRLIEPILEGKAEIVVADRQTDRIKEFSPVKKLFQKVGSYLVRILSGTEIPDAPSGFRAYSREAAMQMNIVTDFSYVIETIIQAGKKRIPIASVPVKTNPKTRDSRLFKNIFQHIKKSGATMVRVFAMYEPLKSFFYISLFFFTGGFLLILRFIYFLIFMHSGSGHLQSLILAAILIIIGFQVFLMGILADAVAANRKLQEKILLKMVKIELDEKQG